MRKGIKIKAFIIFLSWFMIFTHGIIPHNHIDQDTGIPLKHNHDFHHNQTEGSPLQLNNLCDDTGQCSITGILFQKFSTDEYPVLPDNKSYINPLVPSCRLFVKYNRLHTAFCLQDANQLRAPPSA